MSEHTALLQAILRRDLASFIAQCFGTLEPGTPYLDNWHIHAIAYQMMRVWRGECKRLIINVPPRSAKSICVTIAYTAWVMAMIRVSGSWPSAMPTSSRANTPWTSAA